MSLEDKKYYDNLKINLKNQASEIESKLIEKTKRTHFVDTYGIINPDKPGEQYRWSHPALWSRRVVEELQLPMPVVIGINNKQWLKGQIGEEYYRPGEEIPWVLIANVTHSNHPTFINEKGERVSIWHDNEFINYLQDRGDIFNPFTNQWERRFKTGKGKYVPFTSAVFWAFMGFDVSGEDRETYVSSRQRFIDTHIVSTGTNQFHDSTVNPNHYQIPDLEVFSDEYHELNNQRMDDERFIRNQNRISSVYLPTGHGTARVKL